MNNISVDSDLEQRERALNIHESFIIQAPAGSGKTELLIQRLLVLLNHVSQPQEVLAITFTKKAANEMRERVISALKDAAELPEPTLPHKHKTWCLANGVLKRDAQHNWQLINNPNQLQIKTIDSLCSYLTSQLPLLTQFGSAPTIADAPNYLYEEAAVQIVKQLELEHTWSQPIGELLLHIDNDINQLINLIKSLLARRDQWLPHIFYDNENSTIIDFLEQQINAIINDSLATVRKLFPKNLLIEAHNLLTYSLNNQRIAFTIQDDFLTWRYIVALLLTKEYSWRKTVNATIGFPAASSTKNMAEKQLFNDYKERHKNLLLELENLEDLRLALEDIGRLPPPGIQHIESSVLEYLIPILKLAAAQLRISFQQHGKIDFVENALAALAALGNETEPTNLALTLDYKIQHILIDEFQDTSSTQYQLLYKLTYGWQTGDGRSLFVVGDPMQSIYRFREAEVGLFIRMRMQGIGYINLIPLTLALNFRSAPTVVNWNNQHFSAIFPQRTNLAMGAVSYSKSITQQQDCDASVSIYDFAGDEQSIFIVQQIKSWQLQYPNDTIAILVRSRSHLKNIIPVLRDNSIAYQAVEIDPLSCRQHIIDLLSLTSALMHLADRISWIAILRAPWCGLSLSDLLIIAGTGKQDIIWQRLLDESIINQLSLDGQLALRRTLPALQRALTLRGRGTLREWIETTWLLLGGPASLNNESEIEDIKRFFEMLAMAEQENDHFNIEKLNEKISKSYAVSDQNAKLQIMTIHAAKGLEFDSVILPHLEKSLPADDKSLLVWMEHTLQSKKTALLLAPLKAIDAKEHVTYDYIRWQQKLKAQFETDRLFYVAATRAKKRLLLSYDKQAKLASDSFLKKLQPFITDSKTSDQKATDVIARSLPTQILTRLPSSWRNPLQLISQPTVAIHNTFTGFQLASDLPKQTGIIIHTLLQQMGLQSIEWWLNLSNDQHILLINNLLSQINISNQDKRTALSSILKAIDNTINDPRGQWILHQHNEANTEFPLTIPKKGKLQHYIIDRTFVDINTRWIIDYKTSHPATGISLEAFLLDEKTFYAGKMEAYADAIRHYQSTAYEVKLGLYFPLVNGWIEWSPLEARGAYSIYKSG